MWAYRNLLRESTTFTPNDDVRRFDPFTNSAIDPLIQICELRRPRPLSSGGKPFAIFGKAGKECTAGFVWAGRPPVPQFRQASTGRPRVGSSPGDASGLTS